MQKDHTEELPPAKGVHSLFAYGTLMLPEVMSAICKVRPAGEKATLAGYARYLVKGQTYPAIIAEEGAVTEGLLYRGLAGRTFTLLDDFEGVIYRRIEVEVMVADGSTARCHAYVLDRRFRNLLSDSRWDADLFRARDLAGFLAAHGAAEKARDI